MTPRLSTAVLTKRSDFRSAEGLVRCSPFEGVEFGKQPGRYRRFAKRKGKIDQKPQIPIVTKQYLSCESGWNKPIGRPL
jgi:hypothetical protein